MRRVGQEDAAASCLVFMAPGGNVASGAGMRWAGRCAAETDCSAAAQRWAAAHSECGGAVRVRRRVRAGLYRVGARVVRHFRRGFSLLKAADLGRSDCWRKARDERQLQGVV